jgi:2'-5' RNA ligase
LRTFIAIDLPGEILNKIGEITKYFQALTPSKAIKWVSMDKLHLTLKFLGEVQKDQLETIKSVLIHTLDKLPPCEITIKGLGMFPNANNPRVIWLGITDAVALISIQQILDNALATVDIPREKRVFSPHLTLGRVRSNAKPADVEQIGKVLSQYKVDTIGRITVNEIRLYQSELRPGGPIYTPLLVIPLNAV